jgi:hypothetical protein
MPEPKTTEEETLPPLLFHYTDSNGLLGIVRSRMLWATHAQFLNDESELRYPRDLMATLATRLRREHEGDAAATVVLDLVDLLTTEGRPPDTFVASFCENGDLLSQWRGYGGVGGGYAIGMSREQLFELARFQDYQLIRLMYGEVEQEAQLETAMRDAIQMARELFADDEFTENMPLMFEIAFTAAMLSIKNLHFREEAEWRLARSVWFPGVESAQRTVLRTHGALIVPYEEFALSNPPGSDDVPIIEIVVGPTPHPDLAESGVRHLLDRNNLEHVLIRNSAIPFRG